MRARPALILRACPGFEPPLALPLVLAACAPASVGSFPASDPQLEASNRATGDPYAGRFPYEEAVAGLEAGQPHATLTTDAGVVHCELAFDTAPLAVANFIALARGLRPWKDPSSGEWNTEPYYVDLPWHRVEERQFVQTGLQGAGPGADASVGFSLQDERSNRRCFRSPGGHGPRQRRAAPTPARLSSS